MNRPSPSLLRRGYTLFRHLIVPFGFPLDAGLGDSVVRFLFYLACCFLAVGHPDLPPIWPEVRPNYWAGLFCAVPIVSIALFGPRRRSSLSRNEVVVSLILATLAILSALASERHGGDPLLRAWVIVVSGLGGFWCARKLLSSPDEIVGFYRICVVIYVIHLGVSLLGYCCAGEVVGFYVNAHPLIDMFFLVGVGPLALVLQNGAAPMICGALLLAAGYLVIGLTRVISTVFIPAVVGLVAFLLRSSRWSVLIVLLSFFLVSGAYFVHKYSLPKFERTSQSMYYRAESYPFSWHVAKLHPLLGIGPRAARDHYLADYRIRYPYVSPEDYRVAVKEVVTSENNFLTIMVDFGFPFLILYAAALAVFFTRLFRAVRNPPKHSPFDPIVLAIPLVCALLHGLVYDSLYFPQVCWWFHVLLALIPRPNSGGQPQGEISLRKEVFPR